MRRWRFLLFLSVSITFAASGFYGQESRFKVLAFYSEATEPDHVQFAHDAVKFLTEQVAKEHFTFESTDKWEDLSDERLKGYQLVIWLNESPSKTEQRRAFERYIEHGGAWLGFHAAAYNDKDTNWPWFVDFLGGAVFSMNSWPPLPALISIDDQTHAVMAGLPSNFESPSNEWYIWKPNPRNSKNVRVLATLDPSNYPMGFKDILTSGDLPVVWSNTKYKMLYMNMGHGDKIFTSPTQKTLIDNAVNWLGTSAAQGPARSAHGASAGQQGTAAAEGSGIRVSSHGIVENPQSGKFYAVNTAKDAVTVLDGNGHFLARTPVGKEPVSIAVNPDTNRIYVANSGSGNVTVIDGNTDKVIATVPVGDLPYTITVNRASNKVFVSRTFSDVTVIIDGKTNVPTTVKAGVGDAVAAESLDNSTYMTSYESLRLAVFDSATGQNSEIETPNHMWAMAVSTATKKVYSVSVGNSNVTVIDGNSHSTKVVKTGQIPCAIDVDQTSGSAYIANYASNNVTVIDGTTDLVAATVSVGPKPQAIAVDSSSHKVYVAGMNESTATVLDGTNNSVLGTVKTKSAPFAIAVNSKTHVAAVLSLDGELTLIDGAALRTSSPSIPKDER
jgi:YVTN family beta-propeller protein